MGRAEVTAAYIRSIHTTGALTVLHFNAVSRRTGLSVTELEALYAIKQKQPITAGDIARTVGLTTGAVTGLLDRLQDAGLVCRANDPADRRRVLVAIVADAKVAKKVQELYGPLTAAVGDIASELTIDELQFAVENQEQINKKIEENIKPSFKK